MHDIHVILNNAPGALASLGRELGKNGVGLEGGGVFSVADISHAHFLVEDGEKARTVLTAIGKDQLQRLGAVLNPHTRRKPCCPCMDWSERRCHLGGDAGAALMALLLQKAWISRTPGYREVSVTTSGKVAMSRLFGLALG